MVLCEFEVGKEFALEYGVLKMENSGFNVASNGLNT